MSWFDNGEQKKQPWDDIREPLGDLEAARTIRAICTAAVSTEAPKPGRLARLRSGAGETTNEPNTRAAKIAMELAMKISDPLVRDSAVRQIIGLCIASRDVKAAQILTRAIQSEGIRAEVLRDYPALRGEGARGPRT
jgi:hypothetical protein